MRPRNDAGREANGELEPDAQLVQQCLRGDVVAWEELVRRHTRRVYNLCYRFVGNSHEAEDLTQEVFLRVYRTISSYRAVQGGFTTWMTSVTRNLLIDHYRRTKRDRMTDSLDVEESAAHGLPSPARGPDRQALASELSGQVQHALKKLSDLQGLDYREIQGVLGVPEGTVKSRINRGRIELARYLEQMGVRPE
jgi:RNA polymerase sigma-70 factor (ECF subfamily)